MDHQIVSTAYVPLQAPYQVIKYDSDVASLQYDLHWTTKRLLSFSDIQKYRRFAVLLKTTFVHIIVDGMEQKNVTDFNAGRQFHQSETDSDQ